MRIGRAVKMPTVAAGSSDWRMDRVTRGEMRIRIAGSSAVVRLTAPGAVKCTMTWAPPGGWRIHLAPTQLPRLASHSGSEDAASAEAGLPPVPTRDLRAVHAGPEGAWFGFQRSMAIVVRAPDATVTPAALRRAVARVDPTLPLFDVQTMQEAMSQARAQLRRKAPRGSDHQGRQRAGSLSRRGGLAHPRFQAGRHGCASCLGYPHCPAPRQRIAAVALARRLAGILYAMWRDNRPYAAQRIRMPSARAVAA